MGNLFERLAQGRPPPTEEAIKQQYRGPPPTEKLLDWLVNHWTKSTVTARDICIYGPHSSRDVKTALRLAQILVEQGWLIPLKARRRNMHEWQIVPKTSGPLFLKLIHQQL
jgi:hypothetical protein